MADKAKITWVDGKIECEVNIEYDPVPHVELRIFENEPERLKILSKVNVPNWVFSSVQKALNE